MLRKRPLFFTTRARRHLDHSRRWFRARAPRSAPSKRVIGRCAREGGGGGKDNSTGRKGARFVRRASANGLRRSNSIRLAISLSSRSRRVPRVAVKISLRIIYTKVMSACTRASESHGWKSAAFNRNCWLNRPANSSTYPTLKPFPCNPPNSARLPLAYFIYARSISCRSCWRNYFPFVNRSRVPRILPFLFFSLE